MIWDEGTYTPERERGRGVREEITERTEAEAVMRQGLQEGKLTFRLSGKKLHGSFTLIHIRGFGGKASWLLIKQHDAYAQQSYDANDYDVSAVSGRSLAEIAAHEAPPSGSTHT
jgi:hypothetical protein